MILIYRGEGGTTSGPDFPETDPNCIAPHAVTSNS
jgi:hypothetical protein